MPLTYKEIAEIIKLIDASTLDEFVVEVGDVKVSVRRGSHLAGHDAPSLGRGVETLAVPADGFDAAGEGRSQDWRPRPETRARVDGFVLVRSPMVGTFYRRPSPDQPPFIEVGSRVRLGDPICLVEVMKLFTTLYAETAGRVVDIEAEDGALVEYDQVLFVIEPEA